MPRPRDDRAWSNQTHSGFIMGTAVSPRIHHARFLATMAPSYAPAAIFGHYGDRIGRKAALIATLLLTGLSTFLVGCVPTYEQIGLPPAALVIASGLLTLLKRTRMAALAFQRTRKHGITVFGDGLRTERRCDWGETHKGGAGLHGFTAGGRWIRTIGPPVACELCWRGPPLLPARERERFSAISSGSAREPLQKAAAMIVV
jgi:MFS family permease